MKFKSPVYSAVSGSIAGLTYSHNAGGLYTRARAIPVNPSTARQSVVRAGLVTAVGLWLNDLSSAERDGWDLYAANVLLPDRFGDARQVTGMNHYVRSMAYRIQAGIGTVATAPTNFSLPELTPVTPTADVSAVTISTVFNNGDEWATAVGGALLVYAGQPVNPTVNSFAGPWKYAGSILGAVSPPTSPQTVTNPFAVAEGQRQFFRYVAITADGRASSPFRVLGTVVA